MYSLLCFIKCFDLDVWTKKNDYSRSSFSANEVSSFADLVYAINNYGSHCATFVMS